MYTIGYQYEACFWSGSDSASYQYSEDSEDFSSYKAAIETFNNLDFSWTVFASQRLVSACLLKWGKNGLQDATIIKSKGE